MPIWQTKYVFGGVAQGDQIDSRGTFGFAKNLNYRKKHDITTINQKLVLDSSTTLDALPHWIKDLQGTVYTYLANGKIYERISAASWVLRKTVTSGVGQGLGTDASYLYYANSSFLGRFPVGGTWGVDNNDTFQAITGSSWNPVKVFANVNLLCVGNDNKLAVYDYAAANFSATRLVMPAGFKIRQIEEWGDYLAISCWTGSQIRNSSKGKLILWDGLSETFNAVVDSNNGNLLGAIADKNMLDVFAGVTGDIYRASQAQLFHQKKIPNIDEEAGEYVDIIPGSFTSWRGIPHFGLAGAATAASLSRGVYAFGSNRAGFPESLNMEYTISPDVTDTNVAVGALHTSASNLFFVGWKNSSTYGIDLMSTSLQYDAGYLESLWFHGSQVEEGYQKRLNQIRMVFKPLTAGQSIVAKVRNDYSASFATVVTASTAGTVTIAPKQLANGNAFPIGKMYQLRIELNSASGVAPSLISAEVDYDVIPTT